MFSFRLLIIDGFIIIDLLLLLIKTRTSLPILTSHPNAPCGFYAKVCISTANTLLKEGRLQHRIRKLRITDILFLWLGTFFFTFLTILERYFFVVVKQFRTYILENIEIKKSWFLVWFGQLIHNRLIPKIFF